MKFKQEKNGKFLFSSFYIFKSKTEKFKHKRKKKKKSYLNLCASTPCLNRSQRIIITQAA